MAKPTLSVAKYTLGLSFKTWRETIICRYPALSLRMAYIRIKITNELKERQFTNQAELLLVEHDTSMQVFLDKYGQIHTLSAPIAPLSATTDDGSNVLPVVSQHDSTYHPFMHVSAENPDFSSLTLTFPKARETESARLLLKAKNSFWLDYIFGKFNSELGKRYDNMVKKQEKVPAEEKRQWMIDQGMMLEVQLKTASGWQTVDYLDMVGPMAAKDLLIPVDLTAHQGEEVEIRLLGGFHFWELDYAAIDYTEHVALDVQKLNLSSAVDEKGTDVSPSPCARQMSNTLLNPK